MVYCKMRLEHLKEMLIIEETVYDDPWTEKQFRNTISNDKYRCFVIIVDNEIAGYVILFNLGAEWSVENLTVAPDYRRGGIGTKLIKVACDATSRLSRIPLSILVHEKYLGMHLLLRHCNWTCSAIEKDGDHDFYFFESGL